MVHIKALLAGIAVVTISMADISGVVTDTGKTPIPGVVVQLEAGKQTAISGADGRFKIDAGAAVRHGTTTRRLANGLAATLSGNCMTVELAQRSAVEFSIHDLTGKSRFAMQCSLEPGCHSLSFPHQCSGVFLYRVKSGSSEIILKRNAVYGASAGSAVSTQGQSTNFLAKQAKATAAINDVIIAKKTGLLNFRCAVGNSDTSGIVIKMIANAGDITDAEGNVYQTVRAGKQIWMTENLRVTKYNDGSAITGITSAAAWDSCLYTHAPGYCFYNNTTIPDSIRINGALYNWYVVDPANPKQIALAGWRVPTDADWTALEDYLIANGYNWDGTTSGNNIAKSMAAKTNWETFSDTGTIGCNLSNNNKSGFSALPCGSRDGSGEFFRQGISGYWWSSTESSATYASFRYLHSQHLGLDKYESSKRSGFSVRLVRD